MRSELIRIQKMTSDISKLRNLLSLLGIKSAKESMQYDLLVFLKLYKK